MKLITLILLVYFSRTNNIEKLVQKLNLPSDRFMKIINPNLIVNERFVLLTYTDFLGQIPKIVSDFLELNSGYLVGVAGSGNRNFGNNFCASAIKISEKYNVPILEKFELSGDDVSIENFRNKLVAYG